MCLQNVSSCVSWQISYRHRLALILSICAVCAPLAADREAAGQVVVGWTARNGTQVQRVATRRLRVTSSMQTHLQSLDVPLTALLLAKGVVGRALELQAASDGAVRTSLCQALGTGCALPAP